jgi:hypothetical protein
MVSAAAVVSVTSIATVLLPQFLKQSGSVSEMWLSPGSSTPSRLGNDTVIVPVQAGEHATRKLRLAGFSTDETLSNGSLGIALNVAAENMLVHVAPLTKGGRLAHSLRLDGPMLIVSLTLVRKSYAYTSAVVKSYSNLIVWVPAASIWWKRRCGIPSPSVYKELLPLMAPLVQLQVSTTLSLFVSFWHCVQSMLASVKVMLAVGACARLPLHGEG